MDFEERCKIIFITILIAALIILGISISLYQGNKYCFDYVIDGTTYHNPKNVHIHSDHGRISFEHEGIKYNIPYTTYEKTKHPKDNKEVNP